MPNKVLEERVSEELATNVLVVEPTGDPDSTDIGGAAGKDT